MDGDPNRGCGSLAGIKLFVMGEGTPGQKERDLDINSFTFIGDVSLPLDDTANNGQHARWLTQTMPMQIPQEVRYVAVCRGSSGGGRDNVLVDYLGVVPAAGEQCP